MKESIRITLLLLSLFTLLFGLAYPFTLLGLGKLFFPHHAAGSLIYDASGKVVGSKWIGQNFMSPQYFHPRPSFAGDGGYDAMASSGSNLGPTSKRLQELFKVRSENYRLENHLTEDQQIPADAVMASGSGLDPHISLLNAYYQSKRVAQERNIPMSLIIELINDATSRPWIGLFGEKRVNVLLLNLSLDSHRT